MKNKGLRTDPHNESNPKLLPVPNSTLHWGLTQIRHLTFMYMPLMTYTAHSSTPKLLKASQKTLLGTQLKTVSRSKKGKVKWLFCSNVLKVLKLASVVPQPGTKPSCRVNVHHLANEGVQHLLEHLHILIHEFQAVIVSPLQSITFSLVKVQDETLLSVPRNHTIAEDHLR